KAELRPCFSLSYTAANSEKEECGRATNLTNTAAIEKRQSCGRTLHFSDTAAKWQMVNGRSSLLVHRSSLLVAPGCHLIVAFSAEL
ncbi:MAG: hypothetical protein J6X34_08350, partial [Clostridia bacterium]|nr:hypothetical protein [Clostridia bacterium]